MGCFTFIVFMKKFEEFLERLDEKDFIEVKGGFVDPNESEDSQINNGVGCGCQQQPINNGLGCSCQSHFIK